jgi:hypothetical protein
LSPSSALNPRLLNEFHSSCIVGHSIFENTYARPHHFFCWEGMKTNILHFVTKCEVCQHNKGETIKYSRALQPLPIPSSMWKDISMLFIVSLPEARNKSVIMVMVDHLSRYAHFCALPHPFTPALLAQVFLDHVFKFHGMLTSIVSNHDLNFTSIFCQEFLKLQGTQLNISTTYHPKSDGQTQVVKKCLETYVRCFLLTSNTSGCTDFPWQNGV